MITKRPFVPTWSEHYNGTTGQTDLGTWPEQVLREQTIVSVFRPIGVGELGTNTIYNQTPSAATSGIRLRLGDSGGTAWNLQFHGNSTGTNGQPLRVETVPVGHQYDQWHFGAATWDGGLAATGIRLYVADKSAELAEVASYSTTADGTTAPEYGAGQPITIGNRPDNARAYQGQIYYIARFNRVLTLPELQMVRRFGPLSFPHFGLVLCYCCGRDYGPFGRDAIRQQNLTFRAGPQLQTLLPLGARWAQRIAFDAVAAAAGGKPFHYYQQQHRRAA